MTTFPEYKKCTLYRDCEIFATSGVTLLTPREKSYSKRKDLNAFLCSKIKNKKERKLWGFLESY